MRIKKISACYRSKNDNYDDKEFQFYEILDSIPVPIFIKDSNGIFTNCNTAYEIFMGLERDAIIGKSVYDFVAKNLADTYHAKDLEILAQGNENIYEGTVTTKERSRYVLFHKAVYRSSQGEIQGLVGAIIDITAQKQAEQLLKQRISLGDVVSTISADCLKANSDIEMVIPSALAAISKVMEIENSYFFITTNDGKKGKRAYHWNVSTGNHVVLDMDSATKNLSIHWNIMKSVVQEFDHTKEHTTYYERHNDKVKRIVFPLKNGNEWLGSFHLEWQKEGCIEFSNEQLTLLKLLTEVFVGMLQRQKSEELLRASEEKNKVILEAIPDIMVVVTPDFKIIEFKKARELEKFKHIEERNFFIGKTIAEVLHEDTATLFMEHIALAFQAQKMICFEYQVVYQGEMKYREARGILISEKNILVMIRDITERKIAEEEIHKLTLVVEHSPGEIVMMDINQKIAYVNSTFSKKFGYTMEELKNHDMSIITSGLQSAEFYAELHNTISSGNEWRGEICGKAKNGQIFWTLVSVTQFRGLYGEATSYIAMGQDITEKKLMEKTIEKRNVEIEDVLANLKQTQMQLVQQEKLAGIGQLAAGVAHELNNPLGFVMSNFDSLKKYLTKITDVFHKYRELKDRVLEADTQSLKELVQSIVVFEKQKKIAYIFEDLESIIHESDDGLKRLGEIVKALKLFSRVDKGSEFECYDLNSGIKNTLIIAKNEIKYVAEIKLDLGEIPEIQASSGQINQVLLNIIINAAHGIKEKQMDKLGMIKITSYHKDQFVYCSIEDNGIGMTAETREKIFNAFFTTKPRGQGTGLGLSISYDIVINKHCGDISVISEKGLGTTFIIKLPLANGNKNTN